MKLTRLLMPESPAHPAMEARLSITLHAESLVEGKLLAKLERLIQCGVDVRDGTRSGPLSSPELVLARIRNPI